MPDEKCPKCGAAMFADCGQFKESCRHPHIPGTVDCLRRQLAQRDEQLAAKDTEVDRLDEKVGAWQEASGLIINGDPARVTPDMLEASRQADDAKIDRLEELVERLKVDYCRTVGTMDTYRTACAVKDTELAALKGIVEPLSKTVDEVTPAVGDILWRFGCGSHPAPTARLQWIPSVPVRGSYSTREAAEAARQEAACPDGAEKGES